MATLAKETLESPRIPTRSNLVATESRATLAAGAVKTAYLTTSLIPPVAANSVQVMKMSQAFARLGHDVTLYASHGTEDADPYEFYGVERAFEIRRARRPGKGPQAPASYLASQMEALYTAGHADVYFGPRPASYSLSRRWSARHSLWGKVIAFGKSKLG